MDGENGGWPVKATGSWFVIRTRSRHERILARDLRARGVRHFLPLVRATQNYGGYEANVERPVFPGYLFLRGGLDDVHAADQTQRVAQAIPVPDQDQIDAELRSIHVALRGGAALVPSPYPRAALRVRVREGPFAGMHGVIEAADRRDRIILQVRALGRAVSLELREDVIELMD